MCFHVIWWPYARGKDARANVLLNEAARKGVHVGRKDLPNRAEGGQGKEF